MRFLVLGVLASLGAWIAPSAVDAQPTHSLVYSVSPTRTPALPLQGAQVAGDICVFVTPQTGVTSVSFYLDKPTPTGTPFRVEGVAPYDFNGTGPAPSLLAVPYPTTNLADGFHNIIAVVSRTSGGPLTLNSTFTVGNVGASLGFLPNAVSFNINGAGTSSATSNLQATDGSAASFTTAVSAGATWLTASSSSSTTPAVVTANVNTTGLAPGSYAATITATAPGLAAAVLDVSLNVIDPSITYELLQSPGANRVGAAPIADGALVSGGIYVFTGPDSGVQEVRFFLDNPAGTGTPFRTETAGPFDLAGTAANLDCLPFDTTTLADGSHTITVEIDRIGGGTQTITRSILVSNQAPALSLGAPTLSLLLDQGTSQGVTRTLSTTNGAPANFLLSSDAPAWLSASCAACSPPESGATPASVTINANATSLATGTYTGTITATDPGGVLGAGTVTVTLTVLGSGSYGLYRSSTPDRASPTLLDGAIVEGSTHVFFSPAGGVTRVDFYLDDPAQSGAPFHSETVAPWDLVGGTAEAALPFDTTTLADGYHTVTAAATLSNGSDFVAEATFLVSNGPPTLIFAPTSLSFALGPDSSTSSSATVITNDGTTAALAVSSNAAWLAASVSGSTPAAVQIVVDSTPLAVGTYSGTVTASSAGYISGSLAVTLVVFADGNHDILFSSVPNRQNAIDLNGASVAGDIYVFVSPTSGVSSVTFYIDDPAGSGTPHRFEKSAPFDLNGGTNPAAAPYSTLSLGDGPHSVTAVVAFTAGGSETVIAAFDVANGTPGLTFSPAEVLVLADESGLGSAQATVQTTDGSATTYTLTENAPWLSVEQVTANSGLAVLFGVDATGLAPGTHSTTVTASAPGYLSGHLFFTVLVSGSSVYRVSYSASPTLSAGVNLAGATVSEEIYVFLEPESGVDTVDFYLDDPGLTGSPYRVEQNAPFALEGGPAGAAKEFDTTELGDGQHTVTAVVHLSAGGEEIINAPFQVVNGAPLLQFGSTAVIIPLEVGQTGSTTVTLGTSNLAAASFTITEGVDWLSVAPSTGTTPVTLTLQLSALDLVAGSYSTLVQADAPGFGSATLEVHLSVQGDSIYDLLMSDTPNRGNPALLDGAEISDSIYVFTSPDSQVSSVRFYIDNPSASGTPYRTEGSAPFDLAGGSLSAANPFFTTSLSDGPHTITAVLALSTGGTEVITASFLVLNNGPTLSVSPGALSFLAVDGGGAPAPQILGISTNNGTVVGFSIQSTASWLTTSPTSGNTPTTVDVSADPTGLAGGGHSGSLLISAPGFSTITIPVVLTLGDDICDPLPCSELLVSIPHELDFGSDHGGVPAGVDPETIGTGFTMILPSQFGQGYLPEQLLVDESTGVLEIQSTSGTMSQGNNAQDNALGVGIDVPSQVTLIRTRLVDLPVFTGNLEQVGLWFGIDDRNVLRLFVNSAAQGDRIRFLMEVNDIQSAVNFDSPFLNLDGATVELALRVDPVNREITGYYTVDGGAEFPLGTHKPPPEFFSFDAAGIDPEIGTRSFSGIFANHRNAPAPMVFRFDEFNVTSEPLPPPQTEIAFERISFPQTVVMPTSMAMGPDGRLYVVEMTGRIHAFTLGANKLPISQQIIDTLPLDRGPRLTLGLTVGPNATSGNMDLWLCHSGPNPDAGDINSGTITRLSGPNFTLVEDVIVGLPRAFANHAPNSLHFGPDGRLYITIGGNTGAGAPNLSGSEFGTRMEQYLSAALLSADVFGASWPIDCFDGLLNDNPANQPGIPPCADGLNPIVRVYASGLRNLYDFAFHPNGLIYGPDNGLGVAGTYPPTPFTPCFGLANSATNDPGEQPDVLLLLEEGNYYGHPNPSRFECVYKDGTEQGVPPLPNFTPPMLNLGTHKSANGIIVYESETAFCGALAGSLLMTNYSVGDDLVRVQLQPDGRAALGPAFRLVAGFNDPLPLTQDGDGAIYIGEFGGDRITVLVPRDTGCWEFGTAMPQSLLDVSGAALGGLFYVVAGKTSSGPVNNIWIYNPLTGGWSAGPNRPGAAVENPAVVAHNGKLYVIGGSTLPFSGMVTDARSYDPATGLWTSLPPMPTARGGATAQVLGGSIYVVGGLGSEGNSISTVESFNLATGVWTTAPSMLTPRDNAGSASIDGRLYVFGGRFRNADGSVVNGTLNTVEMYDPALGAWTTRAPMPTGRRTFATATLNGHVLVMGGEATVGGGAFPQNEEYDPAFDTWRTLAPLPTPRHGSAAAVIDGHVYVAGGGLVAGSSFSNILEIFSFSGN